MADAARRWRPAWTRAFLRTCGAFLAVLLLASLPGPALSALIPELPQAVSEAPPEQTIPVFSFGNQQVAPVFLDGRIIALVQGRPTEAKTAGGQDDASQTEVRLRSYLINSRARKYVAAMQLYATNVLAARGITDPADQEPILRRELELRYVDDAAAPSVTIAFPSGSKPEVLYSIQAADALAIRFQSDDPGDIARRVINQARFALIRAWWERQAPALWHGLWRSLPLLFLLIALTALVRWLRRRLQRHLRKLVAVRDASPDPDAAGSTAPRAQRLASLYQRSSALKLQDSLLVWGLLLVWLFGIAAILDNFFFSRPLRNWILGISIRGSTASQILQGWPPRDWLLSLGEQATIGFPLLCLLLLFATALLLRLSSYGVDFGVRRWAMQRSDERVRARSSILAITFKGWLRAAILLLLAGVVVSQLHGLGAFTQPLTILFGLLSLAISLASQNLLRDLINGLLILWEDQYVVGDVIAVGEYIGLVESIRLRITQLRNLDGELISIPNGSIGAVRNLSSTWSQVNYAIDLNYHCDVDRALEVINQVAQDLATDPDWGRHILEPPLVLGVDALAHSGITVRLIIKTRPLMQWDVGREYRRRLKSALDAQGLDIGTPRLELRPDPPAAQQVTQRGSPL